MADPLKRTATPSESKRFAPIRFLRMGFLALLGVFAGQTGLEASVPSAAFNKVHPLIFEENRGQTDPHFDYVARLAGHTAAIAAGEIWLRFPSGSLATERTIRLRVLGANREAVREGRQRLNSATHIFSGTKRQRAAHFRGVFYRALLEGVDWQVYAQGNLMEHDYIVAPGTDPGRIEFTIDGAELVRIDELGEMVISAGDAQITLLAPVLYQEHEGGRRHVAGRFELRSDGHFGFWVGAYDPSLPLVIDPINRYATYLGGTGSDEAFDIAVDGQGNAYITGSTSGAFPTTQGAYNTQGGANTDAFVAKLDAAGENLIYATYLAGSDTDIGFGIDLDDAGNAYVVGTTFSDDFPVVGGRQSQRAGGADLFVTKVAADGASLIYSTYVGGQMDDRADTDNDIPAIAVDAMGAAYVGGTTQSTDFPTTAGAFDTTGPGPYAFKLDPSGSDFAYATLLGSDAFAFVRDVALAGERLTLVGFTGNTDIPTTPGVIQPAKNPNGEEIFLYQIDETGTGLSFATYLGGSGDQDDFGEGVAVDDAGEIYIVGNTNSPDFPITIGSPVGAFSAPVLAKLTHDATAVVYATQTDGVQALAVAVDALNRPTITGSHTSNDILFQQFDANGLGEYATALSSGFLRDIGHAVAVDHAGHAYLTGQVRWTYFPGEAVENQNPYQPHLSGPSDAFVMKIERDIPAHCQLDARFDESTMGVGEYLYTDRNFTVTGGIPRWMVGRMLIQTPNAERRDTSASGYLRFINPVDWWVYVLFDSRSIDIPDWLSGWELRSNLRIRTSLSRQPYLKVFRKRYAAGECVDLGGNYGPGSSTEGRGNYVVVYGH